MQELIEGFRLRIQVARFQELGSEWRTDKFMSASRIIPYARLYYPVAGEGVVVHHGRQYLLRPGWICLVPPYAQAEVSCPKYLVKYWCHFNAYILDSDLDIFSLYHPAYELEVKNNDFVRNLFVRLVELHNTPGAMVSSIEGMEAKSALGLLIAPFLRTIKSDFSGKSTDSIAKFTKLLAYIEKNISRRLTLAELAEEFHLNATYLSNLFAKRMGLPLIAYCNRRRIRLAIDLIWSTGYSISEIADKVGIGDVANFSKMFKRTTGLYPSEYRKNLRQSRENNDFKDINF
jgi:AraC-like DNA-binding protein